MENWDNEIDDVARRMTGGEPNPGFKTRVLARIDAVDARPQGVSIWRWSPIALAAAAILVVAIVRTPRKADPVRMPSPGLRPGKLEITPTVRLKPDPTYVPTDPAESYAGSGFPGPRPREGSRTGRDVSGFSRTLGDQAVDHPIETIARADDLDSLAPPPIEIAPLNVDPMEATESIRVVRLVIAPLDIVAIGESGL